MEISRLFTKNENAPPPEQFLAVQIQDGVIQTAVWQIENGQATVLSFGSQVEWDDADGLVEAVDKSLAEACAGLENEPNRVILGLPEYWLENNKIAPEYSGKVKSILDKLELKPLGFVTTTEAVLQFLKTSEGIPPSVVVIELGMTRIGVVVTRLGEVLGREEVGRSADLGADVEEGLARIDAGQLPPRILVIDGIDPEAQQQLASYAWQDKLPFLHLPKVESLGPEFSVKAVALAGGLEAAKAIGIQTEVMEEKAETNKEPSIEDEPLVSTPAGMETEASNEELANITEPEEDLGFVVNQDIRNLTEPISEEPVGKVEAGSPPPMTPKQNKLGGFLANLKEKFSSRSASKMPSVKFRFSPVKVALVFIVLLVVLAGSAWAAYSQFSRATITVEVGGKTLNQTVDLAVGDAGDSGLPSAPAQTETVSLEKSGDAPTTGEAVVGDKATGEVTVFNKSSTTRTLKSGTVLTTSSNLKFVIDESVTVASQSAEQIVNGVPTPGEYGKATLSVTAARIGSEFNIGANTSLSVDDYPKSTLEAINAKDLAGGTSRTVKAVSKTDRDQLLAQLTDQIKADAVAAQDQQTQGSTKAVPVGEITITDQTFSKGIGEEADNVSLDLKGEVTLLKFSSDDLKNLIVTQLAPNVPSGYEIDPDKTIVNIENVAEDANGVMVAKVSVEAQLAPKLDLAGYKEKLRGQPVLAAKSLFENLDNFIGIHASVTPNFPILSQRLPSSVDRIDIEFQTQR